MQQVKERLPITSLSSSFCDYAQPLIVGLTTDTEIMGSLCEQLVVKICHTMCNDFLRNITTLEGLKEDKAVDAQISLRDELKTYASRTKSGFTTITYT